MTYALTRSSDPASEPVTLAEARIACDLWADESAHDDHLTILIAAARRLIEERTGLALITQTWRLTLDRFPVGEDHLYLPRAPLQSVSSVTYTDTAGDSQTWDSDDYIVSTDHRPGRISPAFGQVWPTARDQADAVAITYIAGYGDAASDVPNLARHAVLMVIREWFDRPEGAVIGATRTPISQGVERMLSLLSVGDAYLNYAGA